MEVDVVDSGVQWGKYLWVRVKVDITKKLVRGKKVTIEGGESQWIQFRYERIPNFCCRCGLLSHALRECSEMTETNGLNEEELMQYGPWLRGELGRKGVVELEKQGNGPTRGKVLTGGASEKVAVMMEQANMTEKSCEGSRAYVAMGMDQREETKNLEKPTHEPSYQTVIDLHEKGKITEGEGKLVKLNAQTSASSLNLPTDTREQLPRMGWEQTPSLGNMPEFKYTLAPNKDKEDSVESPSPWASNMGPMAMSYDPSEGWVTSKLGPTSGHWKRSAREAKQSKPIGEKSPKILKRSGSTPLHELGPKALVLKRRKNQNQSEVLGKEEHQGEEEYKDGGEAEAAAQLRRAL